MAYENGPGISFQPGTQQGAASNPVQEAVQLLSLRLPTVVGARGIAPQALLNGQGSAGMGSMGSPNAAIDLLQKLLMQSRAQTPPMPGGPNQPPMDLMAMLSRGGGGSGNNQPQPSQGQAPSPSPTPTPNPTPPPPVMPPPPRIVPGGDDAGEPYRESYEPARQVISVGDRKRAGRGVLD